MIIAALGFAISTAGVRGLFTAVAVLLITGVKAAKRPISPQQKTAGVMVMPPTRIIKMMSWLAGSGAITSIVSVTA